MWWLRREWGNPLQSQDLPSTKVDHCHPFLDHVDNRCAILIEKGDFVVGLVELVDKDDIVPDEQPFVCVEQLIGERRFRTFALLRLQSLNEPRLGVIEDVAASDIDDSPIDPATKGRLPVVRLHCGVSLERFDACWSEMPTSQRSDEQLSGKGGWMEETVASVAVGRLTVDDDDEAERCEAELSTRSFESLQRQ